MRKYNVYFSAKAIDKLKDIAQYIDSLNTFPHGQNYILELKSEVSSLANVAGSIPKLQWRTKTKYHPREKRLLVKKGKFAVFFHTYYSYVIVDDIVPSSMIAEKV